MTDVFRRSQLIILLLYYVISIITAKPYPVLNGLFAVEYPAMDRKEARTWYARSPTLLSMPPVFQCLYAVAEDRGNFFRRKLVHAHLHHPKINLPYPPKSDIWSPKIKFWRILCVTG